MFSLVTAISDMQSQGAAFCESCGGVEIKANFPIHNHFPSTQSCILVSQDSRTNLIGPVLPTNEMFLQKVLLLCTKYLHASLPNGIQVKHN